MNKKVIKVGLSESSINSAIKEIEKYKQDFQYKIQIFRKKVAERLARLAQDGFNNAVADDWLSGQAPAPNVKVTVEEQGGISLVVASGSDAVFIEFGAGVYHNGSVGTSPHPNNQNLKIGEYGKGQGSKPTWGFMDNSGELHITHGVRAQMPLYTASRLIAFEIQELIKEVFG